jgi:hypothetical protein
MENALMEIFAVVGALGMSASLGFLKKYTGILDAKFGALVKPVQPVVVTAAALALPYLADILHITPVDAGVFIAAPTATIAAITLREVGKRITKPKN